MTMHPFNFDNVDASWTECIQKGLSVMDTTYLTALSHSSNWLPGPHHIFNAFSLPIEKVNYVLFGESPYPRKESANGYAFWDASVKELWSPTGLSKQVNRATSLRNIIKMLLIAEGALEANQTGQEQIAHLNKDEFVQTNDAFFANFLKHGFLLLNATPVLQETGAPQKDARAWHPFINELLDCLLAKQPKVTFVLLGRIANAIDQLITHPQITKFYAEHPYNVSFITNPEIIKFFQPFHLLKK